MFKRDYLRKPTWIKIKIPSGSECKQVLDLVRAYNLATVCEEAKCPNIGECWARKSATLMIMGRVCTRACRFCAVKTGSPEDVLDPEEPEKISIVVSKLGLRYVVITSVDRDDLKDAGSGHFAKCIKAIKEKNPQTRVEVLIPDFSGDIGHLEKIVQAQPFVIGHNVETVARLTPYIRDHRCGYKKSLEVLQKIKGIDNHAVVKSGFMLGLGETTDEIVSTLMDLKSAEVDIVTIGQYLQPTRKHLAVQKYYTPDEFDNLRSIGEKTGIRHIISGPLVRSSYRAADIISLD